MEFVIIRPPLVYGAGVKGNFNSFLKLASKNIPLPLASVKNKSSFVYVKNLVNFNVCINHPNAAKMKYFLASDDLDLSSSELYSILTKSFGHNARLIKCPRIILKCFFYFSVDMEHIHACVRACKLILPKRNIYYIGLLHIVLKSALTIQLSNGC